MTILTALAAERVRPPVSILWICVALWLAPAALAEAGEAPFSDSPLAPAVAALRHETPAVVEPAGVNQLALISQGYEALALRVHLIRHARSSIAVQTFIWTNDECGRLMMFELIEAAKRGVKVRVIADHLFSDQDPAIVAFLATVHPNLELKHYRPATSRMKPSLLRVLLAGARAFGDVNQRMHSKVMLFDDAVLLTGGRNIENTYYDHSDQLNFRDRDVLAVGPVVKAAAGQFEQFWRYRHAVPSRELKDVHALVKSGAYRRYPDRAAYDFGGFFDEFFGEAPEDLAVAHRVAQRLAPVRKALFIYDSPGKSRRDEAQSLQTTRQLGAVLASARQGVVIQTPYLVLSREARGLLRDLKLRSPAVQLRISTNSFASTDNLFAYSANYRLRNQYVEDLRLQIHEFKSHPASLTRLFPRYATMQTRAKAEARENRAGPGPFLSLHAKSLVVDDTVAYVGSYNLDPRSENLNTEVGLLVEDETFARLLQEEIEEDMAPENSWVIGKRRMPLGLDTVNGLVDGLLSISPIDVWPIQNTSSFELKPGKPALPPGHPDFFESYRDVGSFPGTDGLLSQKEIMTRLFKAVGSPLTPIL